MNNHLYQALENLSVAEKRALGEALIVSAESEASAPSSPRPNAPSVASVSPTTAPIPVNRA